ncbi:hypothetical protein ElyMa_002060500, partial [Elysia marginata]
MHSKKYLPTNSKESNQINDDLDEHDGVTEWKQLPDDAPTKRTMRNTVSHKK